MYQLRVIEPTAVDMSIVDTLYNGNKKVIDENSNNIPLGRIKGKLSSVAPNKLNIEVLDGSGEVVAYTAGRIRKNAYHCTTIVTKSARVFTISTQEPWHTILKEQGCTHLLAYVVVGTPMHALMVQSIGRTDLYKAMPNEATEGNTVISLELL
jgi:uncharacterized radical SAM superfamily Fe-S cluster-containing enzyme